MYTAVLKPIAWPWLSLVSGRMSPGAFVLAWLGWLALMFFVPNKSVALVLIITPMALLLIALTAAVLLLLEAEKRRLDIQQAAASPEAGRNT